MKEYLDFLRGSVRPVVTYVLVGAFVVLTFQHPDDLIKDFVLLTGVAFGYWYASRKNGNSQ